MLEQQGSLYQVLEWKDDIITRRAFRPMFRNALCTTPLKLSPTPAMGRTGRGLVRPGTAGTAGTTRAAFFRLLPAAYLSV